MNDKARAVTEEVAAWMGRRGRMSVAELARQTGISQSRLDRRLRGQGRAFDIEELDAIARALGVALALLIEPGPDAGLPRPDSNREPAGNLVPERRFAIGAVA